MAMSQRPSAYNSTSGAGSNRGRPQRNRQSLPTTRPIYEDFRPLSEWKTENEALILLVRLPGFLKEQINCTKDDSKRYIRIYGGRALADNRRLRFNTTYTIPQNCDFNQITTQFDRGILKITLPKLYNLTTTAKVPQQDQETSTSQEKPTTKPQKSDEETFPYGTNKQEKEEEVAEKTLSEKGSTAKRVDDERVAKEKTLQLKKKEDSIGNRKTKDKAVFTAGKLVIEEKNKSDDDDHENEMPKKEENEVKKQGQTVKENVEMAIKEVENSEERQLVAKPQKSDEKTFTFGTNKQEKEEEVAGKTLSEKGSTAKHVDDERVTKEKNLELKEKEDSIGDRKTKDKAVLITGKLVIEEKNKSDNDDHDNENEKPMKEENEVKKEGQTEKENVEMAIKEVKNSEERKLVVNICVAVMVIVGLGLDLFTTVNR